ncbi:hypothetical protein F9054_25790, partial [Escherichia coli]
MGSCAAPSAKGDDKFITTDYLQQCHMLGGADNPNGELPSYITGANNSGIILLSIMRLISAHNLHSQSKRLR